VNLAARPAGIAMFAPLRNFIEFVSDSLNRHDHRYDTLR
jgi:hypothetical protein